VLGGEPSAARSEGMILDETSELLWAWVFLSKQNTAVRPSRL